MSTETTTVQNEPLFMSEKDLEYAYGHINSSEGTVKHCNFADTGRNGFYRFKKHFYGLSDIPTTFQDFKNK